ncbi:MATE family efflux transporter [Lachnoanaerobaculum sp. Marseille-Q4761]|uniref:MATE family efflux transporter n=1 Tax=Lachnoanaerobaculum sp. Marseille-Q4761 TaxID=2819511 RepID=UPI001AA198E4|nr:MATE family efflux transporter [Lachnoanaerobaculum sp. Marseille-Q4761]MBO1870402.1 MATE family efflux transporter [Lachnoanaerobaculum sp. Marseille-Q4761]
MNKEKEMILNGSLWKVCYKLSLPAIIAMVLYGLNVIFDGVFVGRLVGETAFAGISIVYPLTQLSLGLGSLVGVGAGSYLSILLGEDDKETQGKIVGNANLISIVVTIVMMLLGFVFMKPLLKAIGADGETLTFAISYFRITLIGSIFWIVGLAYNMIVRAEGKMKTAALMMGIGLVVNIISNYILMKIFNMGVAGAAWGTNIGMFVYALLFVIYCKRGRASFNANIFTVRADKEIIKEIVSLGMSSLIMSVMGIIQSVIILRALKTYGSDLDITFYGAVFRIFNFSLTPIYGLMRALQPVAGINYGAQKYERSISSFKIFSFVALVVMLPFWLLAMINPWLILGSMLPKVTFDFGYIFSFRIFMSIAPLLSVTMTAMTFWPSIKKAAPAMVIGLGRQLFLYIPLMIILPKIFGIQSIYIGSFIIDLSLSVIVILVLSKDFRSLRKMKEKTKA